jgi:hypothetical protein
MHENLGRPDEDSKHLDVTAEIQRIHRDVEQIREPLTSAFEIDEKVLKGDRPELDISLNLAESLHERFLAIRSEAKMGGVVVRWEAPKFDGAIVGTVTREGRRQPFTLLLRSAAGRPLIRSVSPIGRWADGGDIEGLREAVRRMPIQVSLLRDERDDTVTISAEAEVLLRLDQPRWDVPRVGDLVDRVTLAADRLERVLFDDDRDESFEEFDREIEKEANPDE